MSTDHEAVRRAVREFAESKIAPVRREYDDPGETQFPWQIVEGTSQIPQNSIDDRVDPAVL